MATSRPLMRSPNSPIAIPATTVSPTRPQTDATPIKTAPVAPAKPMWPSAWAAKGWPPGTRKYPTSPETTAATPAAANALRMKSYSSMAVIVLVVVDVIAAAVVVVQVIGALDVVAARQHEDVAEGV